MPACPKCGRQLGERARRCIYCGHDPAAAQAAPPVACPGCGRQVPNRPTCMMCGASLANARPAKPAPAAPAAAPPAPAPFPPGLDARLHPPLDAAAGTTWLAAADLLLAADQGSASAWALKGETLFRLGRWADALAACDQALALQGGSARALTARAACLDRLGRADEAAAPRAQARRLVALEEGEAALKAGKPAEALAAFERIRAGADDAALAAGRGRALLALERAAEALPLLDQALAKAATVELWNHRHDCLLRLGRAAEALPTVEQLLAGHPERLQAQLHRAVCLDVLGRDQEALDAYAAFLSAVPITSREHLQVARQRQEALIKRLRPAYPKLPPIQAGALMDQASDLARRGRLQEAEQTYARACAADPGAVVAWINRASALLQLGRAAEGRPLLDHAIGLAPGLPSGHLMRATLLTELGEHEAALADLDHALALDPYESASWLSRGVLLSRMGRSPEGLESYQRALRCDPLNVMAWFNRGACEQRLGRRAEATTSLRRFLDLATLVPGDRVREEMEQARRALATLASGAAPAAPVLSLPEQPLAVLGGRFELFRELGRGGFGVVHLAWCRDPQGVVALKSMLPQEGDAAGRLADFRREAELWLALDRHPNLVAVQQVDVLDGRLCIAMDLVVAEEDGHPTLDGWLRHRPPSLAQALRWGIQFCHGMEHAYARGLRCHRDIKPANILIDHRRQVRIADFGLAASVGGEGDGVAGTPSHMPPEQWRAGARCDQRSDLYAFGVTLFQMAAGGRLPFQPPPPDGRSPEAQRRWFAAWAALHANAPVPRLDSPLAAVIERCLAKDPAARPAGFAALRAELEALLRGQAGGETVPAPRVEALGREELLNKALSYEALGRLEEALRWHQRAVEADPAWAPAWTARGVCLDALGRRDEAALALARALEADPQHAPAWTAKGNLANRGGEHQEALRCYDQALAIRPDYGLALRNRGNALAALGRGEEARASYARGLELDPGSAPGWANLAHAENADGLHDQALTSAERALSIDPGLGQGWKTKADALLRSGRAEQALPAYERACAALPDDPDCWGNRGGCLGQLGRHDDALASLERALAIDPAIAMAWNNKGYQLMQLKRHQEALAAFERALRLDPELVLALRNRGVCLRDMGRRAQALAVLEQARERFPHDTPLAYYTADVLCRLDRHAEALPLFLLAATKEKHNRRAAAMAWDRAGDCRLALGDQNQAVAAWRNAIQTDPGYAPPRTSLARLGQGEAPARPQAVDDLRSIASLLEMAQQAVAAGLNNEALMLYDQALAEAPGDADALNGKGQLLGRMDRLEEAVACFEQALAAAPNSPGVVLNKAVTEDALKRGPAALASYRRFLALLPPDQRAQHAQPVAFAQQRIRALGG